MSEWTGSWCRRPFPLGWRSQPAHRYGTPIPSGSTHLVTHPSVSWWHTHLERRNRPQARAATSAHDILHRGPVNAAMGVVCCRHSLRRPRFAQVNAAVRFEGSQKLGGFRVQPHDLAALRWLPPMPSLMRGASGRLNSELCLDTRDVTASQITCA